MADSSADGRLPRGAEERGANFETPSPGPVPDDAGFQLSEITFPDIEEGSDADPYGPQIEGAEGEQLDPQDVAPEQIDQEQFWTVFQTAFDLPGMILKPFRPLSIQDDEKRQARAASDSVYALLEIYYPAALRPGSETLAHILTAAPFIIGKVMVLRAIMANARADQAKPVQTSGDFQADQEGQAAPDRPEPAQDNEPVKMQDWHLPGQAA